MDFLYQILMHGDSAILWAGAALMGLLAKYVIAKIGNENVRKYVGRAVYEVQDAVSEVYQTYVSELKKANADGKLTDQEKKSAKDMALAAAKANIGKKGMARLTRTLGFGDSSEADAWLGSKIEAAVAKPKMESESLSLLGAEGPGNPL